MHIPSIAAINTGPDTHLLDHIAPMADLLQSPLIVTEAANFQQARTYYPHVATEYKEDLEFCLGCLAERFDALIECKFWAPHLKALMEQLHGKRMDLIFCPHGQSDKGYATRLLAPYAQQDIVLLYGHLLIAMLKELEIWPGIRRVALIGNYRLAHYRKHKEFYDALAEREIFSRLIPNQPTLLYAPTWNDADGSTSFFRQTEMLLSQLPSVWNLIVKVHPLLEQREPGRYYPLASRLECKPNALLVNAFPPIHPILQRADAYLGDFSSIGYDFLFYQRPMFFFPHPTLPKGRLHTCGSSLDPHAPIFPFIEKHFTAPLAEQQEALYRLAFGYENDESKIRAAILRSLAEKAQKPLESESISLANARKIGSKSDILRTVQNGVLSNAKAP